MTIDQYSEVITTEYNKWALRYNQAVKDMNSMEMSLAAFFCNAISNQVLHSNNEAVKAWFYDNSIRTD